MEQKKNIYCYLHKNYKNRKHQNNNSTKIAKWILWGSHLLEENRMKLSSFKICNAKQGFSGGLM